MARCKMGDTGEVPSEFWKNVVMPTPKTPGADKCENYRTISLVSDACKNFNTRRMERQVANQLGEDQFRFRRNVATREAILTLRLVLEDQIKEGKSTEKTLSVRKQEKKEEEKKKKKKKKKKDEEDEAEKNKKKKKKEERLLFPKGAHMITRENTEDADVVIVHTAIYVPSEYDAIIIIAVHHTTSISENHGKVHCARQAYEPQGHFSKHLVLQLMSRLWERTLGEGLSLTCPDTARRQLKDISEIYDCTPSFVPEENVLICNGVFPIGRLDGEVKFTFYMLEEVPGGTAMCIGLQKYTFYYRYSGYDWSDLWYSFDFNPLLAVGVLKHDNNTSKTNRTSTISLLSDVLSLPILSKFKENSPDVWDFSSSLFRPQLNWFQGFSLFNKSEEPLTDLAWLEGLHNTSIHSLNVTLDTTSWAEKIHLRDMPFLREMTLAGLFVGEFTAGSFHGMPEMEVLRINGSKLSGVPKMIDRMPKLKILEITHGSHEAPSFTIPTKALSTLQNLVVLRLSYNKILFISGKLPPLPKLGILNLDGCNLIEIKENDFVEFPMLGELSLSKNKLTHINENTFRPL
ncbi:uncharacterized protein [Anabrus simplex]|uniref:uncharacterized protein n=1 Tax=Anabrus simplex TaxID=316456 RepID=UPI0035A3D39C